MRCVTSNSRAGWSAGPRHTADRWRWERQWRGSVFSTSSNPVEPRELWDRVTVLRCPVPASREPCYHYRPADENPMKWFFNRNSTELISKVKMEIKQLPSVLSLLTDSESRLCGSYNTSSCYKL